MRQDKRILINIKGYFGLHYKQEGNETVYCCVTADFNSGENRKYTSSFYLHVYAHSVC